VYSQGGLNAAPVDVAPEPKAKGLTVITVASLANREVATTTHSSGKQLPDIADITIDNCVPPEDALVDVGWKENVAAGSTMAAVFISMMLIAEVAARLKKRSVHPPTFVSPNVPGIEKDHNPKVFEAFTDKLFSRRP
jgi:uncharacterized phosphosugar-binding protein